MESYILKLSANKKEWFAIINEAMLSADEGLNSLIVDFNNINFVDTDCLVTLACIIEMYSLKGYEIIFPEDIQAPESVIQHLNNIRFQEYWKPNYDRTRFTESFNNTSFGLWKISESMIYNYTGEARKYIERILGDNKDLLSIAAIMQEILNNIFDHSKSPIDGYIISQFYPTTKKLCFSVCDFGVGIPNAVRQNRMYLESTDSEILNKSLEQGFTTQSTPRNRGFGLNNLLELTEDSNGVLYITSNNGSVIKRALLDPLLRETSYNFQGTLIKVEVDLNTFDEKDEQEDFFDF